VEQNHSEVLKKLTSDLDRQKEQVKVGEDCINNQYATILSLQKQLADMKTQVGCPK
jgi:hypothetical protein